MVGEEVQARPRLESTPWRVLSKFHNLKRRETCFFQLEPWFSELAPLQHGEPPHGQDPGGGGCMPRGLLRGSAMRPAPTLPPPAGPQATPAAHPLRRAEDEGRPALL